MKIITPGRICLFGEHQDYLGLPVIALAISLRSSITATKRRDKKIIIDPGIGFGKSFSHNMEIIKKASLFLGLGCPLMIGVSRKSFIGEIISERLPSARLSGSIAAMLKIVSNGVNIVRVHDVKETVDAMKVWNILK